MNTYQTTCLEAVLPHFSKVQRNGKGFKALCPAHEDKQPSLSIRESNGTILLKCFAGCEFDDIVKAAGLQPSELFATEPSTKPQKKIVATYDYQDASGKLVHQKVRYQAKSFAFRR